MSEGAPANRVLPVVNIVGDLVALGPHRKEDIPRYQRWFNDPATMRTLGASLRPITLEQEEKFVERSLANENEVHFAIFEKASWRTVGTASWTNLNHLHRTAEFGLVIGEPADRGRGFGTEATRLMLDYAFTALDLYAVSLKVYGNNPAGVRAYEKAGFRVYGRQREALVINRQRVDVIHMECLSAEFESPVLASLWTATPPSP